MIRSFLAKSLKELFETGRAKGMRPDIQKRALLRLDALDRASDVMQLNQPGVDFHGLHGKPKRYSMHVNGPWCITFEWRDGDAWRVMLEQYH